MRPATAPGAYLHVPDVAPQKSSGRKKKKRSPRPFTRGSFSKGGRQTEHLPRCSRGLSKSSLVLPLISVWFLFGSVSLLQLSGQQKRLQQTNSCATAREKRKTKWSNRAELPFAAQVSSQGSCVRVFVSPYDILFVSARVLCGRLHGWPV